MNIAIDISPLKSGHFLQHRVRGTGFYLENLKKSLQQYYSNNLYTFFTRGEKLPKDIDLVHYPYFEPFFLTLPLFSKNKKVVTVHDLTPLVFPENFRVGLKGKLKWQVQKVALKNANAIITDSLSSKKDIIKHSGINDSNISVVYLAASEEFKIIQNSSIRQAQDRIQNLRKKYKLPEKFVLYVGDVTWNKNLPRLIGAVKKINVPLVMVGNALVEENVDLSNPWNEDFTKVLELIDEARNILLLGFIPREELVLLYNIATVFAMPSIYEGFGLPILEAISCGCPVVTSKEGSIPEVAGDSAFYINAYDSDNIAKGIKAIYENKDLQERYSAKGLIQSKKFSWKKTAKETVKVYESIINIK